MQTILTIFGTRPEAVKVAPVILALAQQPQHFRSVVCNTGQHREMLHPVLALFGITPDIDLNLMQPAQSLAGLTARLLTALDAVVPQVRPDWILAQGDTTTVMVAALTAYYHRVRFGHIEAGLRTGDKYRPYPEEGMRRIADVIADACFAPTPRAVAHLRAEGVPPERIHLTGNTAIDALLAAAARPATGTALNFLPPQVAPVMITAHRRESFGEPFRELCLALRELAQRFPQQPFVYPVHLNPQVQQPVQALLADVPNMHLLPPLDYRDNIELMRRACLILTDSGGIQEEAPTFGVPLLVLRDTTERPEGIDAGVARLVGTRRETIVAEAAHLLEDAAARAAMRGPNPYGDGQAAGRIVAALQHPA
jgi:UDP-N-acetylglucosamine 2-epimerase